MDYFVKNTAVFAVILWLIVSIPWLQMAIRYRRLTDIAVVAACLYFVGAYSLRQYYLPEFPPKVLFIISAGSRLLLPAVIGYLGIRRAAGSHRDK